MRSHVSLGAVMDIVVWLRSLGLGKYEAVFRENDIDEAVLPSLTHENLKELGVASLGHRVKLLDAIAEDLLLAAQRVEQSWHPSHEPHVLWFAALKLDEFYHQSRRVLQGLAKETLLLAI